MIKSLELLLTLLLVLTAHSRSLQTTYDVIVIGAGSSGIGASVALASKNVNHIILEARGRFGGRTHATKISGVDVDLGASFVHNPEKNNSIDAYVTNLNWPKTVANLSKVDFLDKTSQTPLTDAQQASVKSLKQSFSQYAYNLVSGGTDTDFLTAWNGFNGSSYTAGIGAAVLNRAYYEFFIQQALLNGADMATVSTLSHVSSQGQSSYDYLPGTSYAALILAIYNAYCKNATIVYNQPVSSIDYSGTVVKITTTKNQVYYAKRVINTIPLGVLKSGAITFTPSLPTAYQSAISNIGMGIYNKVIVTLNTTFWNTALADHPLVNLVFPTPAAAHNFPQCFISPTNPKVLLFFIAGNASATLNQKTDAQIITQLQNTINLYSLNGNVAVTNYTITRWEQDEYSKGGYSYYKVGTKKADFQTLSTNISSKLWFAGEHTHPNQSSNVHGAFQTGLWAGAAAATASASGALWQIVSTLGMFVLILLA